jgi:hypothetical protein
MMDTEMSDLTVEEFRTALQQPFAAKPADDAGADASAAPHLVLTEARGLGRAFADREAFVLTFDGPAEPHLPQGTYRLVHERLGSQDVFIVPVARTDDGYQYEANFT